MTQTTDTLYLVTVERTNTTSFWVQAPTWSQAQEDAYGLALEIHEWEDGETTVGLALASEYPAPTDEVWAGGESGGWASWEELRPKPLQTERLF